MRSATCILGGVSSFATQPGRKTARAAEQGKCAVLNAARFPLRVRRSARNWQTLPCLWLRAAASGSLQRRLLVFQALDGLFFVIVEGGVAGRAEPIPSAECSAERFVTVKHAFAPNKKEKDDEARGPEEDESKDHQRNPGNAFLDCRSRRPQSREN